MVSRSFLRAACLTCLTIGSLALAVGASSTAFAGDVEYAKACNECSCNAAKNGV